MNEPDYELIALAGKEARELLNNRILIKCFEAVEGRISQGLDQVNTATDDDVALELIRQRQTMIAIRREIELMIEKGEVAVEIVKEQKEEEEQRNRVLHFER